MKNIFDGLGLGPQREVFERMFGQVKSRNENVLDWTAIRSPSDSLQVDYQTLKDPEGCYENFSRLVIGKLNGGLGTSMGCDGPKSLIKVRGDRTFLDLIVEQVRELNARWDANIPLLLMNSFYTEN